MPSFQFSQIAADLAPLPINQMAELIAQRIAAGEQIQNFTIGDFNPQYFPIPQLLEDEIVKAYRAQQTNYPKIGGIPELRAAIAQHLRRLGNFDYQPEEIVVASGNRPLIYLILRTLIDPGEKIICPLPAWNSPSYAALIGAKPILIPTRIQNNFLVTAAELQPYLSEAALIHLNSPLNPTGTIFSATQLQDILALVSEENYRRQRQNRKPVYLLFDIVYWLLTRRPADCPNPILLNPAIRDYTIFVDGISKCCAATGVRIGWSLTPQPIADRLRALLAYVGAWTPKPEQLGLARYLPQIASVDQYLNHFNREIFQRLDYAYQAIQQLKIGDPRIDALPPQGGIYLSVKIDLIGKTTPQGKKLVTAPDISTYLLDHAQLAILPFSFFGLAPTLPWFRLSIGNCTLAEIELAVAQLTQALKSIV